MNDFLFLPMPGHGHVNPTLAVAAELVRRGHRVTYLLPERFRDAVTATGAQLAEYEAPPFRPPSDGASLRDHLAGLIEQLLATAERVADPLLELHDRLRPALVVGENFSLWGKFLTAARSTPAVHLSPSYAPGPNSPVARAVRAAVAGGPPVDPARLAAVAARYGAQVGEPFPFLLGSRLPTVAFMPAAFQPGAGELGPDVHFVGPALDRAEPDADVDLSAWESGAPGVYVSLGTAFNERPEFFRACLEAFGDAEHPVLISHGARVGGADFTDVPGNVQLAPQVPQLRVLRHCAAFVTHGGMNSTMEAIAHGVPMVVVPQMIEQQVTADRVAELGLGVRLDPADVTPAALADAVATVTKDPSYREACVAMGAAARAAGGAQAAADVLEAAAS